MKKELIKKFLKILMILTWIVAACIVVHIVRNYIIITDLENKVSEYQNYDSIHITDVSYSIMEYSNNISPSYMNISIIEYYIKDGKAVTISNRVINGKHSKLTCYCDEEKLHYLVEQDGRKHAVLMRGQKVLPNEYHVSNCLKTETFMQKLFGCLVANISETQLNGKDCYEISNYPFFSVGIVVEADTVVIEKDTGLVIRADSNLNLRSTTRRYEFDNVEDSIFTEPDLSEYEIDQ